MNKMITKKQKETYDYLTSFYLTNARMPTVREVMDKFNLKSTSSAWQRIQIIKRNFDKCPCCGQKR